MIVRTAVDADLHAFHTDPHLDEGRHDHTWNVQLVFERWFDADTPPDQLAWFDARSPRAALIQFLEPFQGRDLPWWSAEALARAVLSIGTADPIGCVVQRAGYRAEVWRR